MEFIRERASSFAGDIDFLIMLVAVIVGVWWLLTNGVIFYLLKKFRRSNNPKAQYITGEKKEEMKLISLAHKAILGFDILILVFAIRVWYNVKQHQPPADSTIRIIGQQWSWRFVDPGLDKQLGTDDDIETVDELHVVVDKVYHFKLESIDVLHSFSVPVFRLKQDAVPGRVISGWFKPTKTGTFDIQCAEMCGIGHGIMGSKLIIEDEASHNKWLEEKTKKS